MVMIIALSSAILGIELFKESLINNDLIRQLNPEFEAVHYTWLDILINSISLAFLADNSTIMEYTSFLE